MAQVECSDLGRRGRWQLPKCLGRRGTYIRKNESSQQVPQTTGERHNWKNRTTLESTGAAAGRRRLDDRQVDNQTNRILNAGEVQ